MLTDVQIINLGLSKIGASRIKRIDPGITPLEQYMQANYPHWKRVELAARRWVFATEEDYELTLSDTLTTDVPRPFKYALPVDCLRPIRERTSEWIQRGRFIFSAYDTLTIDYIRNVSEADFDPLFDEVLAYKVAFESAEYITQSTSKKTVAEGWYEDALARAGKCNAFVIGPEDAGANDSDFDWLTARYCQEQPVRWAK